VTEPAKLLLIDRDPRLVMLLGDKLRRDGYDVTRATSGKEALAMLDEGWPDLVILELQLPDIDGHELADRIKDRGDIPILVLSAVTEVVSKVESLRRHAEDYVTKPFHYPELHARIERILSRTVDRIPSRELVLGPDLSIRLSRRQAIVDGAVVSLSPTESRLLSVLSARLGTTVTTDQLLVRVWGSIEDADPAYVWVSIRRLRQKLEPKAVKPRYLVTSGRGGYMLQAAPPEA
jgi:DNA-binding response OmpR family regulator